MSFHHRYICEPNNISITAESVITNSKGIKITFFLNKKNVIHFVHTLKTHLPTDDDINTKISQCCNYLKGITEDYIQNRFAAENIMGTLNIHRFLKKVKTTNGGVIWRV